MKLSEEIKALIIKEYEAFKDQMYAESPKEIRDELGQFFTPATISIRMIEKLNVDSLANQVILDPCSGSGNLLAAALIAGADSDKIYGNEYDTRMVKACRERINKVCDMLGKPRIQTWQIHKGDATDSFCLKEFGPDYKQKLEEHYYALNRGQYAINLFGDSLTREQEDFLKDVD